VPASDHTYRHPTEKGSPMSDNCIASEFTMVRVDEAEAVYRMYRGDQPWFTPRLVDLAVDNFVASKSADELREVIADLDRVAASRPADYLPWGRLDDTESAVRGAARRAVGLPHREDAEGRVSDGELENPWSAAPTAV
jgi:hypothetical protein